MIQCVPLPSLLMLEHPVSIGRFIAFLHIAEVKLPRARFLKTLHWYRHLHVCSKLLSLLVSVLLAWTLAIWVYKLINCSRLYLSWTPDVTLDLILHCNLRPPYCFSFTGFPSPYNGIIRGESHSWLTSGNTQIPDPDCRLQVALKKTQLRYWKLQFRSHWKVLIFIFLTTFQ